MNRKKGFTLIELLVVIAIIALLLSILMPSLHKVKQVAQRTVCGSNQHQVGIAMLAYSEEYNSKFPAISGLGSGGWLHDTTYIAAMHIMDFASLDVMFCPSNRQYTDFERYFAVYLEYPDPSDYPNVEKANSGWGMTDYFWFYTWGYRPKTLSIHDGREIFIAKSTEKGAAYRLMMSDIVWTQDGINFSEVVDDYPRYPDTDEPVNLFPSNHLSKEIPTGGNQLYVDGHTEWKAFKDVNNHYTSSWKNVQHWW